ncbi:hypothetical protein ACKGJO_10455 [Gracilimonas sp. Q87]|uniref:hypothetical protein n=1 Tax=Gracilimonas sp. Q87 TaxID=3384766 RepID=UPI0039841269
MKTILSTTIVFLLISVLTSCNQKEQTNYYYSEDMNKNGEVFTLYGEPINGTVVFEDERYVLSSGDNEVVGFTMEFEKGEIVSITDFYEDSDIDSITVEGRKVGKYRNPEFTINFNNSEYNQYYKSGELKQEGKINIELYTTRGVIEDVGEVKGYTKSGETDYIFNVSDENVKYEYFIEDSLISYHKEVMYNVGLEFSTRLEAYLIKPEFLRNDFDFGTIYRNERYVDEYTLSRPTGVIKLSGSPNPNDNDPLILTGYPTMEYNTQNMDDIEKRLNQSITTLKLTIKPNDIIWEE